MTLWEQVSKFAASAANVIAAAAVALTAAATELGELFPDGSAQPVVAWLVRVSAWLGAGLAFWYRHTPVPAELRGFPPRDDLVVATGDTVTLTTTDSAFDGEYIRKPGTGTA